MFKSLGSRRSQGTYGIQQRRAALLVAAVAGVGASIAGPAFAQSGTWIGTANTSWGDTNAWSGGQVADGLDNLADFNQVDLPAAELIVDLAGVDRTIGQLLFGDTDNVNSPGTWAINPRVLTATNTLTLSHSSAPQVTANVSTTINSFFSSGSFTKYGPGLLQFNQNNTGMSGTITVEEGTLAIGQTIAGASGTGGSIGSAAVLLKNGAAFAMNSPSGKIFPSNAISINAGATAYMSSQSLTNGYGGAVTGDSSSTLTISGTTGVNFSSNTAQFGSMFGTAHVLSGANLQFRTTTTGATVGGGNTTFIVDGQIDTRNPLAAVELGALSGSGTLNGPGTVDGTVTYRVGAKGISSTFAGTIKDNTAARRSGLTKIGGGATLTLTGNTHTFTGPTNVNEGTLVINGTKTGTGVTNVSSGAVLAGTGNWSGLTTINNGAKIAPGNSVGDLTLGSLTLAAGSQLDFEFGSGVNDRIVVSNSGGLTLNGGAFNLYDEGTSNIFSTNGTYQLIGYGGAIGGSVANLSVAPGSQVGGKQYNFGASGGFITLNISDVVTAIFWNQNTGGDWSLAGNWTAGGPPNGAGKTASFGGGGTEITADANISLNGSKTVGTVTLNNPVFAYTIDQGSGGSLIFDNDGATAGIIVNDGNHTISAPVQVTDAPALLVNTLGGDDGITISGAISGTTDLTKSGPGRLVLSAANSYVGNTAVSDGTLQLADGNNRLPVSSSLAVTATGHVDLNGLGQTVSSLSGGGTITSNKGPDGESAYEAELYVNGGGNFAGVITNGAGGNGFVALTKTGSDLLTLSGSNAYTGTTTVSGGTLSFSSPAAVPAQGSNTIEISNNAAVTIGDGASATVGTLNFSGAGGTFNSTLGVNQSRIMTVDNLSIATGATATMTHNGRVNLDNGSGGGILNLNVPALVGNSRYYFRDDWAGFTGTINMVGTSATSGVSLMQNGGNFTNLAQAHIDASSNNPGVNTMAVQGRFFTDEAITLGALSGTADARLRPDADGGPGTFAIGALNTSTTFAGLVTDNTDVLSINKIGTGTLTLTGANTYTGVTTVSNGALALGPQAHAPVLTGQGAILNGGKVVMDYTGGSSPKAALVDAVDGIKANAADPTVGRLRTALAVDSAKAIGWLDDGTSTFQARFTHKGDINLDGAVDSLDLNAFIGGYGMTSGAEWGNGDFDYTGPGAGKVNTEDFNYLAGNFGAAPLAAAALPGAALGSVVPEPSTIGLLGLGGVAMLTRRRRGN